MKSILFIIPVVLLLLITTCASDQKVVSSKELKEYYYPIEDLEDPKVYYYKSGKELDQHLFWKLSKKVDKGITYLLTDAYTYDEEGKLKHLEEIKEKITEKGSFVVEYIQYEHDDFGNTFKLNSVMYDSCVFLWEMTSDEKIEWAFSNQSRVFENKTRFISKKRQLQSTKEKAVFNGSKHKAILFRDDFNNKYTDNQTKKTEYAFKILQTSYFVKGIGMVSYSRKFDDGSEVSYTLEEIIPIDEWNTKFDN